MPMPRARLMSSRGIAPAAANFCAISSKLSTSNPTWWMPLHTSYLVVLEMEDRQVNRPIRKEIARHDGAVQLGNLGQAEHFDIKPGRLLLILGRDRNVLDLRHLAPPFANDSHGTLVHPL